MTCKRVTNVRRSNSTRRNRVLAHVRATYGTCWICGLPVDKGVPARTPLALEVDELVPVSQGGSPYDFANVRAAHRCCNQWRSNNSVAYVERVQALIQARGLVYFNPLQFVTIAKSLKFNAMPVRTYKGTTQW